MRIIDSREEYLVDLKWPHLLPESIQQPVDNSSTKDSQNPTVGQTFQLTGWRGAGWRMVFPDESTRK